MSCLSPSKYIILMVCLLFILFSISRVAQFFFLLMETWVYVGKSLMNVSVNKVNKCVFVLFLKSRFVIFTIVSICKL